MRFQRSQGRRRPPAPGPAPRWHIGDGDSTHSALQRQADQRAHFCLLRGAGIGSLPGQELADQVLQHDRRLRLRDGVAGIEVLLVAAGFDADVLVAQQPGGQDLRGRILRELVGQRDRHRDHALERLAVQADAGHASDRDACAAHRRSYLQASDVVETGLHVVGAAGIEAAQIGGLQRQEHQPRMTSSTNQAHQRLSIPFLLIVLALLAARSGGREHQRGAHEVHAQHAQRRDHDGARWWRRPHLGVAWVS